MQQKRERLAAAEPAVGADQLLERRDLVPFLPVGAVEDDVRAVGEAVGAPHVAGGVGPERRERVRALDPPLVEVVGALGAQHHRAVLLGADEHEADAGVIAQGRQQPRIQLARSARSVTRPGSRGKLSSPRQPEAITDDLRRAPSAAVLASASPRRSCPSPRGPSVGTPGARTAHAGRRAAPRGGLA